MYFTLRKGNSATMIVCLWFMHTPYMMCVYFAFHIIRVSSCPWNPWNILEFFVTGKTLKKGNCLEYPWEIYNEPWNLIGCDKIKRTKLHNCTAVVSIRHELQTLIFTFFIERRQQYTGDRIVICYRHVLLLPGGETRACKFSY